MAKLPPYATLRALEIWERYEDGRKPEAKQMVIADLESGRADDQVQWIAAQMLKGEKRGRGRPSHPPTKWPDIGAAFEDAIDNGKTFEVAREETAAQFDVSETHAENALRTYRQARD